MGSRLFFNPYIFASLPVPTSTYGWRAYVDAASSTDIGYSVAVDSQNNVYLVGGNGAVSATVYNSAGASSGLTVPTSSAFIVQYSQSGAVNWRAYVNGTGTDVGRSVDTDSSGNVYLAGLNGAAVATVFDSGGVSSGLTVPIASAFLVQYSSSGAVNWRAYVDAASSTDIGYAVATDSSSNVYLVGGNGTVSATVFNSAGVSSGLTVPTSSAFIVQYSSSGAVNWRAYVNGTGTDVGRAVDTDSSGNVYLAGLNGAAVATVFDSAGVSSGLTVPIASAFLVQYSPSGAVNWRAYVDAASSTDIGYAVAVDSQNNVYLAGVNGAAVATVFDSAGVSSGLTVPVASAFLVKYSSTGGVLWRAYVDHAGTTDSAFGVAVDSLDNVYITGTNASNGTSTKIFNSNVYGTTWSNVTLSVQTAFIVKYDSTGKYVWNSQVDCNSSTSADIGYGITTDPLNNVYIVGTNPVAANIYNSSDIISPLYLPTSSSFIVKYNSAGEIDDQSSFKRWPPVDIPYASWAGSSPSFSYTMSGQLYGNGVYNITSTAPGTTGYDTRTLFDNSVVWDNSIGYVRSTTPAFIQIQFPSAVVIRIYGIYPALGYAGFTAWTFDGSDNGSSWTTLDTKSSQDYASKGGGWWSYVNNVTAFSYYRINFTAPASGNFYLRNWRMYQANAPIDYPLSSLTNDTTLASSVISNPLLFNAFDNNTSTFLNLNSSNYSTTSPYAYTGTISTTVSGNTIFGDWVSIILPNAIRLTSYRITPRNDASFGQTPRSWMIAGSNDGTTWASLDERSTIVWTQGQTQFFTVSTVLPDYARYRIIIRASLDPFPAIAEWKLSGI